jgi:hypothetical protein
MEMTYFRQEWLEGYLVADEGDLGWFWRQAQIFLDVAAQREYPSCDIPGATAFGIIVVKIVGFDLQEVVRDIKRNLGGEIGFQRKFALRQKGDFENDIGHSLQSRIIAWLSGGRG